MSQASQVFGHHLTNDEYDVKDSSPRGRSFGGGMAKSAIVVSAAFVLSRALGLAREVLLANLFGTSPQMSAYVSAFRIPDLLFLVVMSGAFGAAFIPVFAEFVDRGDTMRASRLASAVLTWTGIGVTLLAVVAYIGARPLSYVVSPDFDASTRDIAVELMRILLLSPLFLGLGIAFKGILEAQNQFALPALSPVVYNLAIIVGAWLFARDYGIYAVAWSVIAAAFLHMAVQLPGIVRSGFSFVPTLDRNVDGLRQVLKLLGPRVVGLAAFQVNFIAVTAFASTLGEDKIAALNYAWQLLMLPHGVLALSISTVAFPSLAALYGRGDREAFAAVLDGTMRPLLFLSIPASIGLWMVGRPIVVTIFESGKFTDNSSDVVSYALAPLAFGLVGYGVAEILTRVFYAMRDTRTPVITTVLTIILNILLCALFIDSRGVQGLTAALSVTTAAEAVIMMVFLRQRSGRVFAPGFFSWLIKVIVCGAILAAVILLTRGWLNQVLDSPQPLVVHLTYFALCIVLYVGTYFVAALALNIPEMHASLDKIMRRVPIRVRSRIRWMSVNEGTQV